MVAKDWRRHPIAMISKTYLFSSASVYKVMAISVSYVALLY